MQHSYKRSTTRISAESCEYTTEQPLLVRSQCRSRANGDGGKFTFLPPLPYFRGLSVPLREGDSNTRTHKDWGIHTRERKERNRELKQELKKNKRDTNIGKYTHKHRTRRYTNK